MDQHKEFLLLQLRNAISDKEWHIACGYRELSLGEWSRDWRSMVQEDDSKIESLTQAIASL